MIKVYERSMIPEYLIEAYMGSNESDREAAINRIECDLPEDHLKVYLLWNGIIGYDSIILSLAKGSWYL